MTSYQRRAPAILGILVLSLWFHPVEARKNSRSRSALLAIGGGGGFSEARPSRAHANATSALGISIHEAAGESGLHKRRSELSRAAASARRSNERRANFLEGKISSKPEPEQQLTPKKTLADFSNDELKAEMERRKATTNEAKAADAGSSVKKVDCSSLAHFPKSVRSMYINLDRRPDRRRSFEDNMQQFFEPLQRCHGWSLERLTAVDKRDVIKSGLSKVKDKSHLPGAIAAAQSHLNALKKALEVHTSTPLLIFEDDFRFHGEPDAVLQRMERAFSHLNHTWDVVMFGDNSYRSIQQSSPDLAAQIGKTKAAWCSEAYLVQPQYISGLIDITVSGLQMMRNGSFYVHEAAEPQGVAFDTLWLPLQEDPKSNWIVFRPKIGGQANTWGDSDIA